MEKLIDILLTNLEDFVAILCNFISSIDLRAIDADKMAYLMDTDMLFRLINKLPYYITAIVAKYI